jgi:hypothetical protein
MRNFWLRTMLLAGLASPTSFTLAASVQNGQISFQADFEGDKALAGWSGPGRLEAAGGGGQCVALVSKPGERGAVISRRLPLEGLRGCKIRGTARVRAEDVGSKTNPWNGIKFMLVLEGPSGRLYPQAPLETGSFDWRRAAFATTVPADATNITLVLGLEQVAGKVWMDDVKLTVVRSVEQETAGWRSAVREKGHPLPRLRGAMISPNIDAEGLRVLGGEWGANLIRWQLIRHHRPGEVAPVDNYDTWLEGELKKLDAALPHCQQHGLYVVVDLHSPPGGKATVSSYVGSDAGLFTDRKCQDHFVEVWRKMAARYRGVRPIWGFDLANEPVEDDVGDDCADWQGLAERAARAIREIDPQRTLIVEPARWGGPEGLNELRPLPLSNVVYSAHMYLPHAFTHQGVHGPGPALDYPGEVDGKLWDKAALKRALQPAIDFQQRHNVHLYIGEFSAIRWAPRGSAARYLRDVIEIFEEQGWDWTYHAFREWQGWSVEHGPDKEDTRPAAMPTDRQRLLREWFARNQKPAW